MGEFINAYDGMPSAADDKARVDVFLGIMQEQVKAFIDSIDYDSITAAKRLIQDAEAKGGRLHPVFYRLLEWPRGRAEEVVAVERGQVAAADRPQPAAVVGEAQID